MIRPTIQCNDRLLSQSATYFCQLKPNHGGPHAVEDGPEWYWRAAHDAVVYFPRPAENSQAVTDDTVRVKELEAENQRLATIILECQKDIARWRRTAKLWRELALEPSDPS